MSGQLIESCLEGEIKAEQTFVEKKGGLNINGKFRFVA